MEKSGQKPSFGQGLELNAIISKAIASAVKKTNADTNSVQEIIGKPGLIYDLVEKLFATDKAIETKSAILSLLSAGEKLMLEANDGKSKIYGNGKIFKSYIDDDFKNWGLNKNSQTTAETLVDVYEIIKDAKFAEIFTSLNCDLNKLVMTQAQIVRFCEKHPTWLRQDGNATLFLIKENDEYFVVLVFVYAGGLYVRVYRFDFDRVWHAACRLRVVFPQLIA